MRGRLGTAVVHARVAAAAAWLLTEYWWFARRGDSPAALASRARARTWRVVPSWLPSSRVMAIVSRVARVHPLRPACLPQALAGCHLLSSAGRSAAVRVGVARGEAHLRAHAWVLAPDLPNQAAPHAFVALGDIPPFRE